MMKIKISNIEHLTDARYFSSKEVAYLGFDRISTPFSDIKLIQDWVYGPQIVSEFIGVNCEVDIRKMLDTFETEVLHFDFHTTIDTINSFSSHEIFQDINIDDIELNKLKFKLTSLDGIVDYFVLKSKHSFNQINKELESLIKIFPCFIDVKFDLEDMHDIIKMNPEGIILKGGDEERVGVKSFEELDRIFEKLGS